MAKNKSIEEQDLKDIGEMNAVVQKALEMLLGAGGHKDTFSGLAGAILGNGTSSLANALKVGMGVTVDHWHMGYKDVTMEAFRTGLQNMMDHHFIALKLLEGPPTEISKKLNQSLENKADRTHILKVLGLDKKEIQDLNKQIEQNPNTAGELISNFLNTHRDQKAKDEQRQKIEFMINGAMCYLPFSEPNDGRTFDIPVKNTQGKYESINMEVERINMSPGLEGPYYALNLKPTEPKNKGIFQEQIVFMGTNPLPTASGPSVTLHADSISGMSVGQNFVDASTDLFEKKFKESFKDNLKALIKIANDENHPKNKDFKNEDGSINYDKIWKESRVKCVGQSLGGSIPLQMLVKFPYMVEIGAFEPPFLLEKYRKEMDSNLTNANSNFGKLLSEIKTDPTLQGFNFEKLNDVIDKDKNKLGQKLQSSNTIIVQLLDFVTKYGTLSPPATIYHVDTTKATSTFHQIKNLSYKSLMAVSVMSHAMALAGIKGMRITSKTPEDALNVNPRASFTSFLHKAVWKMAGPPLVSYFQLKHFYLKNVHNPKMNPSKSPVFLEKHKEILVDELKGKWKIVKQGLDKIGQDSWQNGQHLHEKMQELKRMMDRAENLGLGATHLAGIKAQINVYQAFENNEKQKMYVDLLKSVAETTWTPGQPNAADMNKNVMNNVKEKFGDYCKKQNEVNNIDAANTLIPVLKCARQELIENYSLLDKSARMEFLKSIRQAIDKGEYSVTSPKSGLLKDLEYRAQSPKEKSEIHTLIKAQEKILKNTLHSMGEIGKIAMIDYAKISDQSSRQSTLNNNKESLVKALENIKPNEMLQRRIIVAEIGHIEQDLKNQKALPSSQSTQDHRASITTSHQLQIDSNKKEETSQSKLSQDSHESRNKLKK